MWIEVLVLWPIEREGSSGGLDASALAYPGVKRDDGLFLHFRNALCGCRLRVT